jgi:hypothetical protein
MTGIARDLFENQRPPGRKSAENSAWLAENAPVGERGLRVAPREMHGARSLFRASTAGDKSKGV